MPANQTALALLISLISVLALSADAFDKIFKIIHKPNSIVLALDLGVWQDEGVIHRAIAFSNRGDAPALVTRVMLDVKPPSGKVMSTPLIPRGSETHLMIEPGKTLYHVFPIEALALLNDGAVAGSQVGRLRIQVTNFDQNPEQFDLDKALTTLEAPAPP